MDGLSENICFSKKLVYAGYTVDKILQIITTIKFCLINQNIEMTICLHPKDQLI